MRNIINMIIKIAIIWGAAWMFPEYVKIQDTRTMVLVAVSYTHLNGKKKIMRKRKSALCMGSP